MEGVLHNIPNELVYIDDLLVHPREALTSPGSGSGKATQKPSQNQSGQMRIWKQGSFLPGIYSYAGREQTESNQGSQTTYIYQDDQVLRGPMKLLPDA
jgi:hypothetical protein